MSPSPSQMNILLEHARYYVARGFHPIPLAPRTKKPPICKGGWERYQKTAPTDSELEHWFIRGEGNIALALGNGKMAVDFDGPGAEEALRAAGVELPEDAPRSKTTNGCHVLLAVSGPCENRVGLLKSPDINPTTGKPVWQIDVRGDGGYIVVAPSVHPSGAPYEWLQRPDTLPDAPQALLTLLAQKNAPTAQPGAPAGDFKWVADMMEHGIHHGGRDHACTKLAGYYFKKGHPEDVVRTLCYVFADKCSPSFPHDEVDKCVTSVKKREAKRREAELEMAGSEITSDSGTGRVAAGEPFQYLGYDHGTYYYLPRGTQQVMAISSDKHTKNKLIDLAPYGYWSKAFPGENGPRWDYAVNALMRRSQAVGVYDQSRVRGRGAWWDVDHAVLHLGDQLIVSGRSTPIMDVPPGPYIYEAAAPMPVRLGAPLAPSSAHKLVKICELITWERQISARLLAGWITIAPICGALEWRPHIWVTGAAGTGKSWIMKKLLWRLINHIGLEGQSTTTEAGVRQMLINDARPVSFDEIEGEDERARDRVQNVLTLARQASSENGAPIIKGSPLGQAKTYRIRSAFAFASIGVGLTQQADASRVSVLSVQLVDKKDPVNVERFKELEQLAGDTLTEEYVNGFNARAIKMIPVIRANARIFASAVAQRLGSQRMGDQLGALLAGAYSLHSDGLIDVAAAAAWIGKQDLSEQQSIQEASDERRCLNKILATLQLVPISGKGPGQRSVGELIEIAAEKRSDGIGEVEAQDFLLRLGIRVERTAEHDVFIIANDHEGIRKMLVGTPWEGGWNRILRRVPGAQATETTVRFAGTRSRGVALPLELVVDGLQGQVEAVWA
jgi:putative DNA primase/helicase